jgi:glycosyltransferase involved in cell wall biosynthesis
MEKVIISACLITKNEELLLEQCLESLKDVAAEIIVLDTGSTDGTKEIIRTFNQKYPALKLYETVWPNDFSRVRNECVSYATGDWVLCIDADEIISEKTQKDLPGFVAGQPLDQPLVFEFKVTSAAGGNVYLLAAPYYKGTLFRNGFGISFAGAIHESLTAAEVTSIKCPFLEIYHYELLKPPEILQRKQQQYIETLQSLIGQAEDIEDKCYYWLNLAQSYSINGDSKNALRTYFLINQAFNTPGTNKKNKVFLAALEGICNDLIFREGDYLRALKYINEILMINPGSATGFYLLGYSQHFNGFVMDAVLSLEKALNLVINLEQQEATSVPYDEATRANILAELGRCLLNSNKEYEGLENLKEALVIVPGYYRPLLYLEKYYLLRGALPEAVNYHLQNDFINYPPAQKNLFSRISSLPANHQDYKKLLLQMLDQLWQLQGWTAKEQDEIEVAINNFSIN